MISAIVAYDSKSLQLNILNLATLPDEMLTQIIYELGKMHASYQCFKLTCKHFYTLVVNFQSSLSQKIWKIEKSIFYVSFLNEVKLCLIKECTQLSKISNLIEFSNVVDKIKTWELHLGGNLNAKVFKKNPVTIFCLLCSAASRSLYPELYETYLSLMKWALQHGANPNPDSISIAPLFYFIAKQPFTEQQQNYFISAVNLLLDFGANPNLIYPENQYSSKGSPLQFAARMKRDELVKIMQLRGPLLSSSNTIYNFLTKITNLF